MYAVAWFTVLSGLELIEELKMSKYEDAENFCYVVDCCVCDIPVDIGEMGICETCGAVFHWGECGSWYDGEHCCQNCIDQKDE